MINLLVAVIINGFSEASMLENLTITSKHTEVFSLEWKKFDKRGKGIITLKKLGNLITSFNK